MLGVLKSSIQLSNSINLTSLNIHAENFYRDLLNLIFGYNLTNINIDETNATAIDLGDETEKIAIQVTSTSSRSKAEKTVSKFIKKELHKKYDRLVILNIREKSAHRQHIIGQENIFQIDANKDIWDAEYIVERINDKSLEEIKLIHDFLRDNVKLSVEKSTIPNEVQTIMALIKMLSDESQPKNGTGFIEEPDPEGKIRHRFSSYSKFLEDEYVKLYVEYGAVLKDILESSELGPPKVRRLALHLRATSDEILNQYAGNAKEALKGLVEKYAKMLSENGVDYDETAISFFLINELIKCNVFPNKEAEYV